ncbi:hypothetical protein [Actinocorallia longicatena]|uniref:Golgi phosphoprotein 3 GPP34 n=1 Tax=Actinocorallia longicatena TaxID=111803 RepID=A0ABP6QGF4_9ACTN
MRRLRAELARLSERQANGALRFGTDGALHLRDGAIIAADAPGVPDLETLLTASGRLSASAWKRTREKGLDGVGPGASTPSRLSRAELEMYALIALFDAAHHLAGSAADPTFVKRREAHWLGTLTPVPAGTLLHELRTRRTRLTAAWPSDLADDAPLVPVRRLNRQRVILTGLQAELLLNADDQMTPAELARKLGRTRFGCTLAVRGLIASALAKAPDAPEGVRVPRRRTGGAPRRTIRTAAPAEPPRKWAQVDTALLATLQEALRELE